MALDETRKEQFKRRLHNKSDEDIWLELDTRTIDLAWKRSLAKLSRNSLDGSVNPIWLKPNNVLPS